MEVERKESELFCKVDETFDAFSGSDMLLKIDKHMESDEIINKVTLDFERCNYINSSGISKLVELYNQLRKKDIKMQLINLSESVGNIFKLTYMDKLFGVDLS